MQPRFHRLATFCGRWAFSITRPTTVGLLRPAVPAVPACGTRYFYGAQNTSNHHEVATGLCANPADDLALLEEDFFGYSLFEPGGVPAT